MSVTTTYAVQGMTCGHCVNAVTEELTSLDGVSGVDVALVAGGVSTVTVTSDGPLDAASVAAAVDEAGYAVVDPDAPAPAPAGRPGLPLSVSEQGGTS